MKGGMVMDERNLDLEAIGTFNVDAFKESVEKVKKASAEILKQDKKVEQIDLPIPKAIEFKSNDNMSVDEVFNAINPIIMRSFSLKKMIKDANQGSFKRKEFKIPVDAAEMGPMAFPIELSLEVQEYREFYKNEYPKITLKYRINKRFEV